MVFRRFSTVDPQETLRFATYKWWNSANALHPYTDLRVSYLKKRMGLTDKKPFQGLRVLDVGCGGGLISERLGRLGASVVGIDPTPEAIEVAQNHLPSYLKNSVQYYNMELGSVERSYDLVLASEVIEHTTDPIEFMMQISKKAEKGGNILLTTVNRTYEAYLFGILAAEYIFGIVEQGTHQYEKFVRPDELKNICENAGIQVIDIQGWFLDPIRFKAFEVDYNRIGYMTHCIKSS